MAEYVSWAQRPSWQLHETWRGTEWLTALRVLVRVSPAHSYPPAALT